MKDKDFDTSELLSSLDKLKAKYSFDFESESKKDEVAPSAVELTDEPVIDLPAEEPENEKKDEIDVTIEPIEEAKSEPTAIEVEQVIDTPKEKDMSWLIDSADVTEQETAEAPEKAAVKIDFSEEPVAEPKIITEEAQQEVTPVVSEAAPQEEEAEPVVEKEDAVAWYLQTDDADEEETVQEDVTVTEPAAEEITEEIKEESVEETEPKTVEAEEAVSTVAEAKTDDDDDDFADLDDDTELTVIRHEENKEENVSPFYAAFMESTSNDDKKVKPPKPVKSPKPPKPVKEPKVKKEKAKKGKAPKKLILNIVVAAVLIVAIWACAFATDYALVYNWSTPVFCAETKSYPDGSKTFTGAFYQIQISVDDDGSVDRVCLPWFVKGPNADK